MATLNKKITGSSTTELISADTNINISKISLANIEGTNDVSIDLFISKENDDVYYYFKELQLPIKTSLVCDINYNARVYSLFIKLSAASGTPAVDVMMS
mgnify:CR=1 FL=1